MATPKYVKTTISKDGKKLRDEYDDGSFKNVRPNPEYKEVKAETKGKKIIDATQGKSKSSITLTPEEIAERDRIAGTKPPKYVSDAEYDELAKLYELAEKSSQGNVNKKTAETLAFQKRYHELLPDEARRIINAEKDITTHGKATGTKYDLKANEDMMFGKRTKQYWQAVKKAPKTPVDKVIINPASGEPVVTKDPWVRENLPIPSRTPARAPWWLQDIVKTAGAAGDFMRINRHLPYQQRPEMYLPEGTYYDPTRELAANAEQANIQTQGMGAFAGPQALSARSSSIQGQALKNAADIEARYNNLNVGISNQLSQERTNIRNQQAQNVAGLNTQLWDKYTIANQQFDNSRNMARQNLRQSYIDAITNRAKAQALNSMFPNYNTNPGQGGMIDFIGSNDMIHANKPNNTNEYWDAVALTGSRKDALDYLKMMKGMKSSSNPYDQDINYAQQQQYPSQG